MNNVKNIANDIINSIQGNVCLHPELLLGIDTMLYSEDYFNLNNRTRKMDGYEDEEFDDYTIDVGKCTDIDTRDDAGTMYGTAFKLQLNSDGLLYINYSSGTSVSMDADDHLLLVLLYALKEYRDERVASDVMELATSPTLELVSAAS